MFSQASQVAMVQWPSGRQSGVTIKQAGGENELMVWDWKILDEVAALCTQSIFEPSTQRFANSIQKYVYKALIDRYGFVYKPNQALFLAFIDSCVGVGCVVGCLGVRLGENFVRRPVLEFLSVDPVARSHGIGKSLIEHAEAQVREWGFNEVVLQVAADNAEAIQLYEKMGYFITAEDSTIERPHRVELFGDLIFVPARHFCMLKHLDGAGLSWGQL